MLFTELKKLYFSCEHQPDFDKLYFMFLFSFLKRLFTVFTFHIKLFQSANTK